MTSRMHALGLAVSAFALLAARTHIASAATTEVAFQADGGQGTERSDEGKEPAWRVSAALGAGNTEGAMLAGSYRVMGGIEPNPLIFMGLSYRGIRGLGEYDGYGESLDTDMVSAALEVHPAGAFWVDPYVSADLGYGFFRYEAENEAWEKQRREGLAAAAGLGLAFRGKHVSGGPQLSYITVPAASTSSILLDLRLDVRF